MAYAQTNPASSVAPAATNRVAVVNLRQVYENLDEKAEADQKLEKARGDFAREAEKRKGEVQSLAAEVAHPTMFKAGSPEQLKLQDELLEKTGDLQTYTQVCEQKLFIQLRTQTLGLRRKMDEAIAAHAREKGIVLVLVADELPLAAARSPQELEELPTMRKLAYFSEGYDITRAVVQRMNGEYGGQRR
jgi:Skp family chaperone for outer membrane proteins